MRIMLKSNELKGEYGCRGFLEGVAFKLGFDDIVWGDIATGKSYKMDLMLFRNALVKKMGAKDVKLVNKLEMEKHYHLGDMVSFREDLELLCLCLLTDNQFDYIISKIDCVENGVDKVWNEVSKNPYSKPIKVAKAIRFA